MTPISGARPSLLPALRAQAREKLHALPCVPGPSEIEWTALVMAETQLATPTPATKEQGWLSARAAAAGMLSPALAAVLNEVEPKSLMPFEEVQGGNRMRLIGRGLDTLTKANRAAGLEDVSRQGFKILGVHNATEKAALEGALDVLISRVGLDRLKSVADRFELATALGQLGDKEHPRNVAGLAGGRTVALERSLLTDPKILQIKLDHEVGHLVDQHLATKGQVWRSHEPGSPFGQPGYVSEYAGLNAHEDFAETHALVLSRWDEIKKDPTLEVFARGKLGEKMAWILEHAYDIKLGEPPPERSGHRQAGGGRPVAFRLARRPGHPTRRDPGLPGRAPGLAAGSGGLPQARPAPSRPASVVGAGSSGRASAGPSRP